VSHARHGCLLRNLITLTYTYRLPTAKGEDARERGSIPRSPLSFLRTLEWRARFAKGHHRDEQLELCEVSFAHSRLSRAVSACMVCPVIPHLSASHRISQYFPLSLHMHYASSGRRRRRVLNNASQNSLLFIVAPMCLRQCKKTRRAFFRETMRR
jgi:hypothetical protein